MVASPGRRGTPRRAWVRVVAVVAVVAIVSSFVAGLISVAL